ncbi:protein scabrous-like [Chrysoperla carnea]|uniref:protein scabrous-like n=1 Tax=Chrysoperla carnea TaxID=189513 RepID=UPI001D06A22E|nr:protein scabrous-like [Chrysoperla carnea]
MAQTLSEIALMKDDQTNFMEQLHTLSTTVNTMHDKFEFDHETLEQLNITVSLLQASNYLQNSKLHDHILKVESSKLPEGIQHLNTSSTNNIVEELEEVENEYHSIINKLPHDCTSVQGPPGLYLISPGPGEPVMVSCNNGWTTVQRRHDGSVDFNRNWDEYSRGFGSASGEFWIGNRVLNRLTHDNCTQLHIKMIDIYGKSYYAEYDNFVVENYPNGYRLHVSGYHGNSSDALDYQNHMEFSTIDNDRDISNTHCASNYEGGWWFSHCQHANLNGKYNLGLTWFDSSRNEWIAVATSEMKVKRHPICQVASSISPSDTQ